MCGRTNARIKSKPLIMNILLPTDFSDNADLATEFAFQIARQTNGRVMVFHAYDLPYSNRSMSTSLLDIMRENAENNMEMLKEKLAAKYEEDFSTLVRLGNPIRLIAETSMVDHMDIIVMGTKGSSGLEEILIGSNAASVIQNSKIPVLVIPPQAKLGSIKKIVFACDLDPKVQEQPLERLAKFAQLNEATIDIVHVQNDGTSAPPQGARDFYSKCLQEVKHEFTVLRNEDIEAAIIGEAEKENADVVAAISKQYGFIEGLFHRKMTSQLAYHTSLPLLVLHEPN